MAGERHRIPPGLTAKARRLRRDATFPERLLWSRLRAGRLAGLKFRRQQQVGPYVADFYCAARRLVVEVDGRSHAGQERSDERRTRYLNALGLIVLRFTNDEVIRDLDGVLTAIFERAGKND